MTAALIGFAALFALSFLGVPLAIALLFVGGVGFAWFRGAEAASAVVGSQLVDAVSGYGFSVIPLFVLMGALIHRAGLADDLFYAARAWLGHFRGGIAHATIGACGGFAAVSGSSVATAATMAKVSLPQLERFGYRKGFACGAVAAGGTLGIMIPPSVPLVVYGIITETDIAALFMAALVPGIGLALLFLLAAWIAVFVRPDLGQPAEALPYSERLRAARRTSMVVALFVVILGGMYLGVFTPTEAAGIGALGALILMALRGQATGPQITAALMDTMLTTGALLLVTGSALVFNNFLTIAGLTDQLLSWIRGLEISPLGVIAAICVIYVILGCVFDSLAAMIMTVPVFTPLVVSLGFDPVWFGIVVALVVELGLITPPLGMNVFVVKNLAGVDVGIWQIYGGVLVFVGANLLALLLVVLFPGLALFLPGLLY